MATSGTSRMYHDGKQLVEVWTLVDTRCASNYFHCMDNNKQTPISTETLQTTIVCTLCYIKENGWLLSISLGKAFDSEPNKVVE